MIARHPHAFAAALFAAVLLLWGAGMAWAFGAALLPPDARGLMVAIYPDADTAQASLTAVRRAEGNAVAEFLGGRAWLVQSEDAGFAGRLMREGALGAFANFPFALPGAGGCFFLTDPKSGVALLN
jgi:hypothetical protein